MVGTHDKSMIRDNSLVGTHDKSMIENVLDFFHFGNTLNGNGDGGGGDELTTLKKKKMRSYGKF